MRQLEIKNVSKSFGKNPALSNVTVTFEEGHIYGLLGRNGAGKSTLLNLITAKLPADTGSILVNGTPVWENDKALSQIYCMSEPTYYPDSMRVKAALRWSAEFYENFSTARAEELCDAFEINTNRKICALSTGFDSIFKIIIALSCGAGFILLDEPVLGLDANARELFYREMLKTYSENPAVYVVSTHLIGEVEHLIDHAVILKQGEVLLDDNVDSILSGGYTVTGPISLVESFCNGKNVIGCEVLGGLKTAAILGKSVPASAGLEISSLDLQNMFVRLTNSDRGETA